MDISNVDSLKSLTCFRSLSRFFLLVRSFSSENDVIHESPDSGQQN